MANLSYKWKRNRIRYNLKKQQRCGRPRLSVHRTNKHIYAQLVDDSKGITLAAASSLDPEFSKLSHNGSNVEAAKQIGRMVAERAIDLGVKEVYFDRSSYQYHGRVKELANSAREIGLEF